MKIFWKRFAGWVTDLKNRYWRDPFFRSEFNVITLQFIFAGVLLLLVALSFNYLAQDVSDVLLQGIAESVRTGQPVANDILSAITGVKVEKFYGFLILTALMTSCFSYFIAKVTLVPARRALDAQKRFVSDLAHEIRTPLSIIKTQSEVALMDDGLHPELKLRFNSIVEELNRTSEIINNLLSFGNIIRPERMPFANVDMGKVVDVSMRKLKVLSEQKEIEVEVKKVYPYMVWGNSTALEQIVVNLIKNALNYTPAKGQVTVSLKPDYRGSVLLTVQDTGIGISRKDLEHIFEPFYRADRSRSRAIGSSGLGLTIVSELVKMHSGHIAIRSALNKGTLVTVSLPYGRNEEESAEEGNTVSS